MSTPRYEEVPMGDVISRTKRQLRLTDSSNDDLLELYIFEALDSLDCSSQLVKKQCPVEICDRTIKLPVGLSKFLAIRFECDPNIQLTNDPIDNQIFNRINQLPMIYADVTFLDQCGCSINNLTNFTNTFQINKGYIHLNFPTQATKAVIAYLGLNVDQFGNTLIYRRYERALSNYACAQFTLAFKNEYTNFEVEKYDRTWTEQRNKIIGEDRMMDFQQDKMEIAILMNALMTSRLALITP